MILFVMSIVMFAIPTQAADEVITIIPGKQVAIQEDQIYKITIPQNGIVEYENKTSGDMYFYKKNKDSIFGESAGTFWEGSDCTLVKKGTYYFSGYSDGSFKFVVIGKPANKANYTMKKAIALPKTKKIFVLQQGDMRYTRWYRIKLKKAKTLRITTNYGDFIKLFNAKGKVVDLSGDSTDEMKYYSRKRLKKGTYYFRVAYRDNNWMDDRDYIVTLQWK